jgi:hypothetical protein
VSGTTAEAALVERRRRRQREERVERPSGGAVFKTGRRMK